MIVVFQLFILFRVAFCHWKQLIHEALTFCILSYNGGSFLLDNAQEFIIWLFLIELFLEGFNGLDISILSLAVLDFVVNEHTNLCLSLQEFNPSLLSLNLDVFSAWVDIPKQLLQVTQLELLLL